MPLTRPVQHTVLEVDAVCEGTPRLRRVGCGTGQQDFYARVSVVRSQVGLVCRCVYCMFDSAPSRMCRRQLRPRGSLLLLLFVLVLPLCCRAGWQEDEERLMLEQVTVTTPERCEGMHDIVKAVGAGYSTFALSSRGVVHLQGMGGPTRTFDGGPWVDLAAGTYQLFLLNEQGLLFTWPDVREPELPLQRVALPFASAVQKDMFASGHGFTVVVDVQTSQMHILENNETVALPVAGADVASVCAGGSYAMLLSRNGTLYGHGSNAFGQLAQGNHVRRVDGWHAIESLPALQSVACGGDHVLALARDGRVFSWGWAEKGQLGIGNLSGDVRQVSAPSWINSLPPIAAIGAGGYAHSAAVDREGKLFVWGWNELDGDVWVVRIHVFVFVYVVSLLCIYVVELLVASAAPDYGCAARALAREWLLQARVVHR